MGVGIASMRTFDLHRFIKFSAFGGEKANVDLRSGLFFLRIFIKKQKKTVKIYSVCIALYYKNRRIVCALII